MRYRSFMRLIGLIGGLRSDSDLKLCPLAKVRKSRIDCTDNAKLGLDSLFHF